MADMWVCRINGEGFTVEIPCNTEADAEVTAFEYLSRGVRVGNKIYPNRNIVYCELERKKI